MSTPAGTLQSLARQLVLALQPLKDAVSSLPAFRTFLLRLGWQANSLPPEYTNLAAKVDALLTALNALEANPQATQVLALLGDVKAVYLSINAISSAPEGVVASDFLAEIGERLFDLLLIDYLTAAFPGVYSLLLTLGIITQQNVNETPTRPGFLLSNFNWDEVPKILADPGSIPELVYGWGTDSLDFHHVSGDLLGIFLALGWPAHIGQLDDDLGKGFMDAPDDFLPRGEWQLKLPVLLDNIGGKEIELGLALLEMPPQSGKHPGLVLQPLIPSEIGASYQITDSLQIGLRAGSDVSKVFGVILRPGEVSLRYPFDGSTSLPEAGFGVTLQYAPASPALLLGDPSSTRLILQGLAVSIELDNHDDGLEVKAGLAINGLILVVSAGDQDGFLQSVIGGHDATILIPLAVEWSSRSGFAFAGGMGLRISQPLYLNLGPITIQQLQLALRTTADAAHPPDLIVEIGASISGVVGPVGFSVANVGLHLTVTFQDGNAGPFDIGVGFMPPAGMGLSVDAAGVSGGGFLTFDEPSHEYSGVLQLEFNDLALQAFGLVTTQVAGAAGYSLLALIDANFPPVQLGWGFTLNGVGGLLALNRTASSDALHAALKANTLSSILFPKNAIANAPQVLATLDALFPTANGRFLFGPMALIGWGTPTILTAAIALIVELPEPIRIILIARLSATLPSESLPLVRINMDALGILDLSQDSLSLDATLFDSKLITFTLSGDMALRANWSSTSQREFLLAIGGVHPQFTPPVGFPTLQRITLDMPSGPVSKLRLAAYLAISSNTVQFGATLDVFIGVAGFGLAGHLGFDALLQLDPFHFDADISGRVALTAGGDDLMSIGLDATLSGPAPWQIAGKFSFSLLFFDVSKSFSYSWGDDAPAPQIAPVDVLSQLTAALADARSWGATLAGAPPLISLNDPARTFVHPLAQLEVHENVVPLGLAISHFGSAPVSGATSFTIGDYLVNGTSVDHQTIEDDFAPAQFFDLNDDEKLARPSFESHDAGVRLTGVGLTSCGDPVSKTIAYETYYVDEANGALRTDTGTPKPFFLGDLQAILAIGAAGRAAIRVAGDRKYPVPGNPVKVAAQSFVITDRTNLAAANIASLGGTTYSDAQAALATALIIDPARGPELQIVASHEMAAH
jgi:hypothetical protein